MRSERILSGAMLLLAGALLFNGAVLLLRPQPGPAPLSAGALASAAEAAAGAERVDPSVYLLARNTYFITSGADGREVHLWFYNHSALMRNNSIEHVLTERVP